MSNYSQMGQLNLPNHQSLPLLYCSPQLMPYPQIPLQVYSSNPSNTSPEFRLYLESYQTQFEMLVVLLDCIGAWLDGDAIDPVEYPRLCCRAIIAQNRIGWHAFLPGYWTPEWSSLQDAHLKATEGWTHKCNGRTWATRTITTIWKHLHAAWTNHNDAIHALDAKYEDADLQKRTRFRIIRLHQRKTETMAIHQDYFFEDVDTTLRVTSLTFQRN
jgi:hypothetical protein